MITKPLGLFALMMGYLLVGANPIPKAHPYLNGPIHSGFTSRFFLFKLSTSGLILSVSYEGIICYFHNLKTSLNFTMTNPFSYAQMTEVMHNYEPQIASLFNDRVVANIASVGGTLHRGANVIFYKPPRVYRSCFTPTCTSFCSYYRRIC